jgi:hypothetical protein
MFLLSLLLIHLQADLHLCCNYVNTTTKKILPTSLLARPILKSRKKILNARSFTFWKVCDPNDKIIMQTNRKKLIFKLAFSTPSIEMCQQIIKKIFNKHDTTASGCFIYMIKKTIFHLYESKYSTVR